MKNAMASDLEEPHADSFFRAGDEGTYAGGPAKSVAPVHLETEEDEPSHFATPAQLARRERLRRLVTTVVGSLAGASLLVFAYRLGRATRSDGGVPQTLVMARPSALLGATAPVVPAPVVTNAVPKDLPALVPVAQAPSSEVDTRTTGAATAPATPPAKDLGAAKTDEPNANVRPPPSVRTAAAAVSAGVHAKSPAVLASTPPRPTRTARPAPEENVAAPAQRATRESGTGADPEPHSPPTASFPD